MKKSYKLSNLDCVNCARKMEDAISKLDGVEEVSVNFMLQKLSLSEKEECFEKVLQEAVRICKKVEPDCKVLL